MPARASSTTKTAKPTTKKRSTSPRAAATRRSTRQRTPDHSQIAERAYFIHLEEGSSDEVGNWLRAERELTAA